MATLTSSNNMRYRCNWLRIGGLGGSFSIHLAAVILLAIPMALPNQHVVPAEPTPITVTVQSRPAPLPLPDEPVPQAVPRAPAPPAIAPVVASPVESPMSVPALPSLLEPTIVEVPARTGAVAGDAGTNGRLEYVSIVRPRYPIDAIRRGEQGTVYLRVHVGQDGLPRQVDVERSSGYRQLDRAAREAVLRYRFRPLRVNGMAVEASGVVPIEFSLQRG